MSINRLVISDPMTAATFMEKAKKHFGNAFITQETETLKQDTSWRVRLNVLLQDQNLQRECSVESLQITADRFWDDYQVEPSDQPRKNCCTKVCNAIASYFNKKQA